MTRPWNTRDVLRWNFSALDMTILVGLLVAGLAAGVVDRCRNRR